MATRIIGIDTCLDYDTIINTYNGSVLENQDGTVSVFIQYVSGTNTPLALSKACCEYINPNYIFDIENQKCRWSAAATCNLQDAFKLVLNPKGNDGTLFYVEPNDNCYLTVDFDYLFKIKCETLSDIIISNGTIVSPLFTPNNQPEIAVLNEELINARGISENYDNQIITLREMINKFSYSIICDFIPVEPTFNEPIKVRAVGTSAFGSIAPFGVTDSLVTGQLYCLNEPEGLSQWRTILGEVRYNNFINGDQTAYTCADVQTIFNLNSSIINDNTFNGTNIPLLIEPCTTPVNTKTNLINDLNNLLSQKALQATNLANIQQQINETEFSLSGNSSCSTPLDFFESFDVSMSVDVVTSANTLQTVYSGSLLTAIGSGNLYNYLQTNTNSGFYVCGDPTGIETQPNCTPLIIDFSGTTDNVYICDNVRDSLVDGLYTESGSGNMTDFQDSLPADAFASQWLHYHTVITDPNIISLIANQKIKLSININHTCGDFCVLVDSISLNKVCNHVEENKIFLTQSPGFELDRIRDNKKSWVANTTPTNRPFSITNTKGGNTIRQTNYDVNDERLVINSKEIDLDISLASAIETDIWCYISDNSCLLTGITTCLPCVDECGNKTFQDDECFSFMDGYSYDFMDGDSSSNSNLNHSNCCGDNMIDFASMMTQSISAVTTIEDFQYFLTSELIDAKNRQTISGYPTLRALYDRYMNSGLYCGNNSSRFDYMTMDQFANLVGNYWVDIVEQVVPATTIWGSTKIYSNTIFDQQKFRYKSYSSLLCSNPYSGMTLPSPINGSLGQCASVDVEMTTLAPISNPRARLRKPNTTTCSSICIGQMNSGSEFIGGVTIVGQTGFAGPNIANEANVINEI